jgi:hypothetical protein
VARERHEAWGEAFRDIGILVLVFAPLDILFRGGTFTWMDEAVSLGAVVLGLVLIEIGIRIECET